MLYFKKRRFITFDNNSNPKIVPIKNGTNIAKLLNEDNELIITSYTPRSISTALPLMPGTIMVNASIKPIKIRLKKLVLIFNSLFETKLNKRRIIKGITSNITFFFDIVFLVTFNVFGMQPVIIPINSNIVGR